MTLTRRRFLGTLAAFYKKQGYQVFIEMDDWYTSGHSRIGFRKALSA